MLADIWDEHCLLPMDRAYDNGRTIKRHQQQTMSHCRNIQPHPCEATIDIRPPVVEHIHTMLKSMRPIPVTFNSTNVNETLAGRHVSTG